MKTIATGVNQGKNCKWFVCFETFRTSPRTGESYLANSCESAAVFASSEDALAGQLRALAVFDSTGRFPNMCEVF